MEISCADAAGRRDNIGCRRAWKRDVKNRHGAKPGRQFQRADPAPVPAQVSTMATARVQPADARSIFTGLASWVAAYFGAAWTNGASQLQPLVRAGLARAGKRLYTFAAVFGSGCLARRRRLQQALDFADILKRQRGMVEARCDDSIGPGIPLPSSIGQDATLSRWRERFDSARERQPFHGMTPKSGNRFVGRIAVIVMFGMIVAAPVALAQPDGGRRPRAAAGKTMEKPTTTEKPLSRTRTPNSCAAFGPGFVRIESSDTCVQIGGSIEVGVGGRAR